jgi:hypothetical protein
MVVKANNLDLSKVTFSDVKTDNHGRKMVYVNMNNGKILVQTPKMYAPNGVKRWRKQDAINNKDDKYEMELSFYGEAGTNKNSEEIREFREKWEAFDDLIKQKVIEKSKEWLSMPKLDLTTLESVMYTPMVKVPKDKEGNELPYPSRIRAKIDREMDSTGNYTGRFLCNKKFKTEVLLFDENKDRLEMNEDNAESVVPKGSQVVSILELVYLSLSKTTISTKWKLVQAKVFRNKDTITSYAMLDEDDNENEASAVGEDLDTNEDSKNVESTSLQVEDVEDVEDDGVEDDSSENEEAAQPKKENVAPAKPKGRVKRSVVA